jgi:oligopeptidase B
MLSYSPHDKVKAKKISRAARLHWLMNSQVQYYEPTKWVAKLCAMKTDHNPMLFKIHVEAGHGSRPGRFERYREVAEEFAFFVDQLPKGLPANAKKS